MRRSCGRGADRRTRAVSPPRAVRTPRARPPLSARPPHPPSHRPASPRSFPIASSPDLADVYVDHPAAREAAAVRGDPARSAAGGGHGRPVARGERRAAGGERRARSARRGARRSVVQRIDHVPHETHQTVLSGALDARSAAEKNMAAHGGKGGEGPDGPRATGGRAGGATGRARFPRSGRATSSRHAQRCTPLHFVVFFSRFGGERGSGKAGERGRARPAVRSSWVGGGMGHGT